VNVQAVVERIWTRVMAPLVLGGPLMPGHAIGARVEWPPESRRSSDPNLAARVAAARVRRARMLAPVDSLPDAEAADWALAGAIHDIMQSANPSFDTPLRRHLAQRILDIALGAIDRIATPATVGEALSRHSWFARLLEVRRTDKTVSFWVGSREFLGREPPSHLQAWPRLRRVNVAAAHRSLLELTPLAVDHARFAHAISEVLDRTPITNIATCTREDPAFEWTERSLAFLGARAGRILATRALDRLPSDAVDAVLGATTRRLLDGRLRPRAGPVLRLLADRTVASLSTPTAEGRPPAEAALFARALGAAAARANLATIAIAESPARKDLLSSQLTAIAAQDPSVESLLEVEIDRPARRML
jgi:hypothetical protein